MKEEKLDLRVKKTQRLLVMSLLGLLEKQKFGKITVNDICTEALVSRSAFYAHFEDKYALMSFCLKILRQDMFEKTENLDAREKLLIVFENIRENVKIFNNLLISELDEELMEMFQNAFYTDFENLLIKNKVDVNALPGPVDIVAYYYSSGVAGAIIHWIKQNMQYSTESMADCLTALLPIKSL